MIRHFSSSPWKPSGLPPRPEIWFVLNILGLGQIADWPSANLQLHIFMTQLGRALSFDQLRLGGDDAGHLMTREDFGSGHYACALCSALIRPSSQVAGPALPLDIAAATLSILGRDRFRFDVNLLQNHLLPRLRSLTHSGMSESLSQLLETVKPHDAEEKAALRRSETVSPKFKVGEIVSLKAENGEMEVQVVMEWNVGTEDTGEPALIVSQRPAAS